MATAQEPVANLFVRDDDEGLFSRDINGQLVRVDAPTEGDYEKMVTVQIDGQSVTVPMAEPMKDANGNIVVDLNGVTTPRYTTIYDAATELFVKQPGDEVKIPIPILCHQPHMTPVAVCRVCVVQIYGQKRGARAAERKLLPACQHPVKEGMEVFSMRDPGPDGERVRQAVKIVTELLTTDCLKPAPAPAPAKELAPFNELAIMAERTGASVDRFKIDVLLDPAPPMPPKMGRGTLDPSSPVFIVDHSACIVCERCMRACVDVKENMVIGRTGKGANAGISFDLNDRMGESSCVRCGECMVSCPTSAITFKPVSQVKMKAESGSSEVISAEQLIRDPLFAGVPPKFLLWQQGLVVKRKTKRGEVLCYSGEPGNTAFILKQGKVEVVVKPPSSTDGLGFFEKLFKKGGGDKPTLRFDRTPDDFIIGEMACLSGTPRSADVIAKEAGEVLELRRNVLDRLMRLPSQRERFEKVYRERALDLVLQNSDLFKDLESGEFKKILEYLRPRLGFVRVRQGQVLFRQGDPAQEMYLVRLGNIRVDVQRYGNKATSITRPPGSIIGEIGLLAISPSDVGKTEAEIDHKIATALSMANGNITSALPAGNRTATCSALDHLELARLSRADFLNMVKEFPVLRKRLIAQSLASLRASNELTPYMQEYVEQGLYEGQSILTIDMTKCTRCDACTHGCIDQHGDASHGVPIPRLLRDGLRLENFLVATSCRSCRDPYCMAGCPVDAIHRGRHMQIVIEDHCIGCGLCAENCPYGNISMVANQRRRIEVPDPLNPGKSVKVAQMKASTCDLCDAEGNRSTPMPRCVYVCPHDAAKRMTGPELLERVLEGARRVV